MKNYNHMKKFLLVGILFCLVSVVNAQKRIEIKDQFVKTQFLEIVKNLELDSQKASELEPIYVAFMKELRPGRQQHRFNPLECEKEDQVDAMIRAKLAIAVHIATVREKYYELFRKVLSPSQIVKMYQAERDTMKKVKHEFKSRKVDE